MPEQPQSFTYQPVASEMGKKVVGLCKTDILGASVQIIKEGGENNLHTHPNNDGFWFVLAGRARFYGEGDELIGEYGPHEGVLIPRGFKYWFESAGSETLEIMRVGASSVPNDKGGRVDFTPMTEATRLAMADSRR